MRVALLSKNNHAGGGASRLAETLTLGLRAAGHEAILITARPNQEAMHTRPLYPRKLGRALSFLTSGSEALLNHVAFPVDMPFLRRRLKGFDLVHIHDTWTAFCPWTLAWIARRYPTVWTLHDCAAFTGGCLYMYECRRHHEHCGSCPRIHERRSWYARRIDCTRLSLATKRRAHAGIPYQLVAPSRWIAAKSLESGVFSGPVEVIPNGSDMSVFHPGRRHIARSTMRINPDEQTVLVTASSLEDPRKGCGFAVNALRAAWERGVRPRVLLMGKDTDRVRGRLPHTCMDFGYVRDQSKAADIYAAADLFIFPSKAENLPLSIQESMGCGTPVVAYAAGGIPEMITPGITGDLVPTEDVGGLTDAICRLLTNREHLASLRASCRSVAESEWSVDRFIARSIEHYQRVIGRFRASA